MKFTRRAVLAASEEYQEQEPLYAVEQEQIETLPKAFAAGEYGWRDAEWVIRWYYRRFLGAYPDVERRRREERFGRNDFGAVREAIEDVAGTDDPSTKVERLTQLDGVDVPVASAFLLFTDPERFVVVGEREWTALERAGELSDPYPDPPTATEYETYLETARSVADRVDCELWTLYQALWRQDPAQ